MDLLATLRIALKSLRTNTLRSALTMLRPASSHWQPPVLMLSAMKQEGIAEFWQTIEKFRTIMSESGELDARRHRQANDWMWQQIDATLRQRFRAHPAVQAALADITQKVGAGITPPTLAARQLLALFH